MILLNTSLDVPVARILSVFESIPAQLAKESKKFIPSQVKKNARHEYFDAAITWLQGAGLLNKVPIANSAELPFSAHTQENRFKLYFLDVGLLGALSGISPATFYADSQQGIHETLFKTFKGAFCENFVLQELLARDSQASFSISPSIGPQKICAWSSNIAEIEFMLESAGKVLPIEVKAGLSGKLKSLNVFAQKYNAPYRTRISARNFHIEQQSHMHSYPLYLAYRFPIAGIKK